MDLIWPTEILSHLDLKNGLKMITKHVVNGKGKCKGIQNEFLI